MMDPITPSFNEDECKFFSELFNYCDVDRTGTVSILNVSDLFRSSHLPYEILHQITEVTGAKRAGFFTHSQFFLALRLIAAAQHGLPLTLETLQTSTEVPLPKFAKMAEVDVLHNRWRQQQELHPPKSPDLIQLSDTDIVDHQPKKKGQPYSMLNSEHKATNGAGAALESPEGHSEPDSPSRDSPTVSSTASDSPTPTNSVQEKNWKATHWHGLMNDEHRQLLGTEEESSDRHSSDDDEVDVWSITDEQKEYYRQQFRTMQPDVTALLSGAQAKQFFEKSKLPVHELSRIWQLSDVTKDGALSLSEFFTAMHLVVLKRNHIQLPDVLPPSLIPNQSTTRTDGVRAEIRERSGSPRQRPPSPSRDPKSPSKGKQWTKFAESPTSAVSPDLKPVNFDFQKSAVEQDPQIYHPVAVRLTPDSHRRSSSDEEPAPQKTRTQSEPPQYNQPPASKRVLAQTDSVGDTKESRGIHRPLPKKPSAHALTSKQSVHPHVPVSPTEDLHNMIPYSSHSGPTSLPLISQSAPAPQLPQGPKKEPPPPPPPRPYRTHARSSSLDLNKLGPGGLLGAPPAVPPRASPYTRCDGGESTAAGSSQAEDQTDFADFTHFSHSHQAEFQPRGGAFEVYRKSHKSQYPHAGSDQQKVTPEPSREDVHRQRSLVTMQDLLRARPEDKAEMQLYIRAQRERNTSLSRLNSELNQELSDVMEERIGLELQREHMKPFTD